MLINGGCFLKAPICQKYFTKTLTLTKSTKSLCLFLVSRDWHWTSSVGHLYQRGHVPYPSPAKSYGKVTVWELCQFYGNFTVKLKGPK
jgi:hypothetical protein